jgi:hypothetical protein
MSSTEETVGLVVLGLMCLSFASLFVWVGVTGQMESGSRISLFTGAGLMCLFSLFSGMVVYFRIRQRQ